MCNQCAKFKSLKAENVVSFEQLSRGKDSIAVKLGNLPEIKARPGFDQKMAAAFAMELEREILRRNRSWLKKHPKIKLPNVLTDVKKNIR